MNKKVLIVDDSAFIREILTDIISKLEGFEVIGTAPDPHVAAKMIIDLAPDIITLDIEMPKMDGLTFLEKIIRLKPIPVLIISTLVAGKSELGLKALELGAIDYIAKPMEAIKEGLANLTQEIHQKLKACELTKVRRSYPKKSDLDVKYMAKPSVSGNKGINFKTTDKVIAIGSSTGGTVVISSILKDLPVNMPGIVVVQHMPAGFTKAFADRLNSECNLHVKEAVNGDNVFSGQVLIAPGGFHLVVKRSGLRFFVELNENPPVCFSRPSVDVLFNSVSDTYGSNALGVMLTGMGHDGTDGMATLKNGGAINIAQDEESCTVFGMPKSAIESGSVDEVLPIQGIINKLLTYRVK